MLIPAPIMQHLDWSLLCTNKKPYVVYYTSKTLKDPQMNYTTIEMKLLAIVFVLDKFHLYILGSNVVAFTDHSVIKSLIKEGCKATISQMDTTISRV